MVEPAKLVRLFESGAVTRQELLLNLCQAAADRAPEQLAALLPADVLAEVRERSATPPTDPDQCRVVWVGSWVGSAEAWDRHHREESRRFYDGLWRWHQFFARAEPGAAADRGLGSDS